MQCDGKRIYKRVDGVELSETHDGTVIYDEVNEKVHFVNLVATAILELCDGKTEVEHIKAIIKEAFDLPVFPDEEVDACLSQLLSAGLIIEGELSSSAT
jgi:hypothetical protein